MEQRKKAGRPKDSKDRTLRQTPEWEKQVRAHVERETEALEAKAAGSTAH